jgi:hypothetical protein
MFTRLVFFYPLSASIVILCNILDNPALPSALQDYELLKGVPGLMCGMPTHSLNAAELLHREHLESFVKDLIRAAQYSISSGSGSAP